MLDMLTSAGAFIHRSEKPYVFLNINGRGDIVSGTSLKLTGPEMIRILKAQLENALSIKFELASPSQAVTVTLKDSSAVTIVPLDRLSSVLA